MKGRILFLILISLNFETPNALAEEVDFIKWHSSNIQFLRGANYELGEEKRSLITFEHANKWAYGDFYMFIDATRFDGGGSNFYAELSPRISLSAITGKNFSYGLIKDVLISTTYEEGKHSVEAFLYGGAVDFNISGFKFFKSNFYVRDDPDIEGETWQITLAWNRPLEIGSTNFLLEGFADFAGGEGGKQKNQLIVPRFLLDVGDLLKYEQNKLGLTPNN